MHKEFADTISILNDCAAACNHCFNACLNEKDVNMVTRCISLDRDCADICQLTARMLQSDSEVSIEMLRLCITICEACGDECSRHSKMEHCRECAEMCRKCAEACSKAMSRARGMRAVQ